MWSGWCQKENSSYYYRKNVLIPVTSSQSSISPHLNQTSSVTVLELYHVFILQGVRSSLEATRKCYLRTMKAVTKTLAGRRLMNQRKVFYDVTANLFVYVVELWNTHLQEGVAQLSRGEGEVAIDMLELARLCLKSKL